MHLHRQLRRDAVVKLPVQGEVDHHLGNGTLHCAPCYTTANGPTSSKENDPHRAPAVAGADRRLGWLGRRRLSPLALPRATLQPTHRTKLHRESESGERRGG